MPGRDPRAEKTRDYRNHGTHGGETPGSRRTKGTGWRIEGIERMRAAWQKEIDAEVAANTGKIGG